MTHAEMTDEDLLERWKQVVDAVTRIQVRIAARVEQSGIPAQWFTPLRALLHAEEHRLPMTRLARGMSISSGGFTKLADRMGREGLIDRRNSVGDRRVVFATLTPKGVEAARLAEEAYLAAMRDHVLHTLSPAQLFAVSDMIAVLDTETEEPVEADTEVQPEVLLAGERDPGLPDRRRTPRAGG